MFRKEDKPVAESKLIDIETGMQGNIKFSGPINLRINGSFDGELETKGTLIIGAVSYTHLTLPTILRV